MKNVLIHVQHVAIYPGRVPADVADLTGGIGGGESIHVRHRNLGTDPASLCRKHGDITILPAVL